MRGAGVGAGALLADLILSRDLCTLRVAIPTSSLALAGLQYLPETSKLEAKGRHSCYPLFRLPHHGLGAAPPLGGAQSGIP